MGVLYARKALLRNGWASGVRLHHSGGRIRSIERDVSAGDADFEAGIVIPGLCNAHSHAFQRALVGRTERRSPEGKDNFWTWRSEMYRLASRVDPAIVEAIATQVYSEMLTAGYTSVAEFHYLHQTDIDGIISAAEATGIRLTLVPILYERAGFDKPEPDDAQKLFVRTFDEFVSAYQKAKSKVGDGNSVGVGLHSLRAVGEESVGRVAELAKTEQVPLHMHVAEHRAEVDQCLEHYGTRPARWLLDRCEIDGNWCLVHATHLENGELMDIAASGAVICLCPSTEANLGDGVFPLKQYLDNGGCIAVGSDSHVTVDPFEELRWLEYGQRLATQSRNASIFSGGHTGQTLFDLAAAGGARACGWHSGHLEPDAPADLIVLDDDDPVFLGHENDTLMDALVFSGYPVPIERVMVGGDWLIVDGRHVARDEIRVRYRRAMEALR
jgi:formimidoylglutamate deiminase